jgi:hypothetical protein
MINVENLKIIKVSFENIFVFDDKYVISKSNNITQSDLNSKPDYFATRGLIFLGVMFLMFVGFIYFMIQSNIYEMTPIILALTYLLFRASILYRLSGKSVIYKKDIIRIYINEKRNCIFFKFKESKKRVKIKSMGLPSDINEKEKVLQTLYENNLIDKEYTSQTVKMKEGFLCIKNKFVSFVNFKLYSKNIDAKKYKNEIYQLFALFSFALLGSIVMIIIYILWYKRIYVIGVIVATTSIVYLIILYKQFVKSKTFLIQKNKIADISVDKENSQKVIIKYYNNRKQLKQKELFLPDDEQERKRILFLIC